MRPAGAAWPAIGRTRLGRLSACSAPGEIVLGAVTKPWEASPVFQALPPDRFAAFAEPDFVKIVWSLRADPVSQERSVFRTETRAVATDPDARARFRRYWALSSAGIALIRLLTLRPLKAEAERRWREAMRLEPAMAGR